MTDKTPLATALPATDGTALLISNLTEKSGAISIENLSTEGLGAGLPKQVPLLFDRRGSPSVKALASTIEEYRLSPKARQGTATTTTLQSFMELVNRHKDEHSVVFAETRLDKQAKPSLTAVIDYHEKDAGAARWGKHQVKYDFPLTAEFKAWLETNGSVMEQADFARFLEDHAAELASPYDGEVLYLQDLFKERVASPAEVMALSRSLEVHVGQSLKRQERLQSGERVVEFNETHTTSKGEKVDIPGCFIVSVAAFEDGDPVRIPARLRYRVVGGNLVWFYQLYRWENEVRLRVKEDMTAVAKETGLPVYEGQPEKA